MYGVKGLRRMELRRHEDSGARDDVIGVLFSYLSTFQVLVEILALFWLRVTQQWWIGRWCRQE